LIYNRFIFRYSLCFRFVLHGFSFIVRNGICLRATDVCKFIGWILEIDESYLAGKNSTAKDF